MTAIGNISARTTSQLMSAQLLNALQRTQQELLTTQNEISTGVAVAKPSDAPASAAGRSFSKGLSRSWWPAATDR